MASSVSWNLRASAATAGSPGDSQEDAAVVSRVLQGDREAFALLVRRYQDPLYRLMRRRTLRAEDAEDLTQEAFLAAFRGLADFDQRRPFGPWLFRIGLNAAADFHRRSARRGEVPMPEHAEFPCPAPTPQQVAAVSERARQVAQFLEELPPADREILELFYDQELPVLQVAETIGKKPGAVKTALHRARQKLRDLISKQEDRP